MRELHAHAEVVAVGECGLDYFRDFSPRPAQRRAFELQLQIAVETGKPLFLHQRDAHADFMAMMNNFDGRLGPAVVHCFTGTREELFDYLDRDWHIGITGWLCDERRGQHLRELVKHIPANRLMIETDAPYLLPRTIKPAPSHRRNEPMYLAHIVEELARDRGEDVATAAAQQHGDGARRSSACRRADARRLTCRSPALATRRCPDPARRRSTSWTCPRVAGRRAGRRPSGARARRRPG